jgi:ATP-dependent Lhr-like helicase
MTRHPTPDARSAESAPHPALAAFHPAVQAWFTETFSAPTRAQQVAWPKIQAGETTLILAPTGSGKTLAAFLAAIDRLMFSPQPPRDARCRVLYVSPLKALAVDVERNLRAPLAGVADKVAAMGAAFHLPEIAIRTGDTPGSERARFARRPSDILITTPESLFLLLTSAARTSLRSIRTVIVDEIHTMVATKRGAHLALSLERLEDLTRTADAGVGRSGGPARLQRVGLSATVAPIEEAAHFLGGFEEGPRPVAIADARAPKRLVLTVEVPAEVAALPRRGAPRSGGVPQSPEPERSEEGIWPAIYPRMLELIRAHRSTLLFVNSRRLAERLAAALNRLAEEGAEGTPPHALTAEELTPSARGPVIVRAHHGSMSREQRLLIEEDLKAGRLPALVATSTLELGIDMGAIDLVIQVEAPPSVASGLQRIGRAGHQVNAPSKGVILPRYRGDLLACAALAERMLAGAVEPVRYPRNPLDVLAQQIVGMVVEGPWAVADLERVLRRAAPFAEIATPLIHGVLDMLSGRYPSDDFAPLRPRLTWDRTGGLLYARETARRVAVANAGAIPDRGLYGVFMAGGDTGRPVRVGELDEEMVFESRVGDTFLLGASSWRIEEITYDRVIVSPAPGRPGRMPFWHGDSAGRPVEFGRAIGRLSRQLLQMSRSEALRLLTTRHALTEAAAEQLLEYLEEEIAAVGILPDDRTIVVERCMDEVGEWRVCILSPLGARVHAPWAMAIGALYRRRRGRELDLLWTDDGIVVRFPETEEEPPVPDLCPGPEEVEPLVIDQLGVRGGAARSAGMGAPVSALFASRFREAAARALLLPRRRPGQRLPLWQQRKRAADLLHATARFPSFPIVLETFRECMRDDFDLPALTELMRAIQGGEVQVVPVTTRVPSPFAASLLFHYVANFMYEGDAPLAELRAQALTVDPARLREILGEVALRELLDPDALHALEQELQCLTPERRARHPDALHDMLRLLGALSPAEIAARCDAPHEVAVAWLEELVGAGRALPVTVAGEKRYAAIEDASRYRDALGVALPGTVPDVFQEPLPDPLGDLVGRYARTHGPFEPPEVAARLGLGVAPVATALAALEAAGRVERGEFRPGGRETEWCDAEVLRTLRGRSLARLRRDVAPVTADVLGRLALEWHGVTGGGAAPGAGEASLLDALARLQGCALPASDWEGRVLPARVAGYEPRDLDALTGAGLLLWVGAGVAGPRDGRIAFYLAEQAALLLDLPAPAERPEGGIADLIRDHLRTRGASFFPQILQTCADTTAGEVLDALWDLVWAGEVTNDTLQPLRAYLEGRSASAQGSGLLALGEGSRQFSRRAASRRLSTQSAERRAQSRLGAGRWSLVKSLIVGEPSSTERAAARTRLLLDRHGVLTREAVAAEGVPGGFSAVYPVLRAMEDAGQIRRGYFVGDRGAAQFALPEAVDRLRALRKPDGPPRAVILAATDPANLYGAALPWPERTDGRRPARLPGALVVLVDGAPVAWIGRAERHPPSAGARLLTFPDVLPHRDPVEVAAAVARALADEVAEGRRAAFFIRQVDGQPAPRTLMGPALAAAGFTYGPQGYMKRQ